MSKLLFWEKHRRVLWLDLSEFANLQVGRAPLVCWMSTSTKLVFDFSNILQPHLFNISLATTPIQYMYCKHTLPIYLLQSVSNINRNRARLTKLQEWCLMCILPSNLNFKLAFVRLAFVYICCLCCHYCLCTHTCITQCPFVIEAVLYPLYPHHHHRHSGCININIKCSCDHCLRNSYVPFILSKLFFAHKEKIEARGWLKISTSCLCWICIYDSAQELNNCTMWNKGLVLLKKQIVWQESNKRLPAKSYS